MVTMMLVNSKAAMAVVMRMWRQPVKNFMVSPSQPGAEVLFPGGHTLPP